MKLLQTHDDHFDTCRSFLVISMIFTHAFEMFYLPDYDRRFTYFVTIGFIFISGFAIGAIYSDRLHADHRKYIRKLVGRAYKLFTIYIACNMVIMLMSPGRFAALRKLSAHEIIMSIILGTNQSLFGFDILIPIALTSIFSCVLLKALNTSMSIVFIFLFVLLLRFFETANFLNYYGLKLLFIGFIGCLLGSLLRNLDWGHTLQILYRYHAPFVCGIFVILYYTTMIFFIKKCGSIKVHYHLIPTLAMLSFVYLLSYVFHLSGNFVTKLLNRTMANYMLFAYLFHILLINLLFFFIPKDSLSLVATWTLGLFLVSITMASCYLLDFVTSKSAICARIYSTAFRL